MHARPPETMANSVVTREATVPASMSPSLGPPVTTAIWNDDSRLRNASGTEA